MKPVSGDLVSIAYLAEVVMLVPTKGLVTKISGLSGPERVRAGGTLAVQQVRAEANAPDKGPQNVFRQHLLAGDPAGQVDV